MTFRVQWTRSARDDLARLYKHLLESARTEADLDRAASARDTLRGAVASLERSPFLYRKVTGENPFLRELIIPFGATGYVALYEIVDAATVTVLAVRHQREDDYL
jgi:plasmid stabilization system protein ParE